MNWKITKIWCEFQLMNLTLFYAFSYITLPVFHFRPFVTEQCTGDEKFVPAIKSLVLKRKLGAIYFISTKFWIEIYTEAFAYKFQKNTEEKLVLNGKSCMTSQYVTIVKSFACWKEYQNFLFRTGTRLAPHFQKKQLNSCHVDWNQKSRKLRFLVHWNLSLYNPN